MMPTTNVYLIQVLWIVFLNLLVQYLEQDYLQRQGIVQDLNRLSGLGTLSHIRRLSFPLPSGSKTIGPRKLHNSQWGFVCPSESPDGGNVGIINHLSIMAKVTSNINSDSILEVLDDLNYIPLYAINTSILIINVKYL